jgi:hypothetical protein
MLLKIITILLNVVKQHVRFISKKFRLNKRQIAIFITFPVKNNAYVLCKDTKKAL